MIGGESKISYKWIADTSYMWLVWARKYKAAAFLPEHRFYGDSHPKRDMSTASYQYFSIEQALADLRNFILNINEEFFPNVKTRWIMFGGSYPGLLTIALLA
ncbi:unnamed protein product [Gongylonema pulchrum]|uniref:Peptidase_S9 domain-containing protein n=1 Tax=Gongylonema pulchrum TaxID=637853 RepID=A0A183E2F2_9BILA|nr:unnamed protein product [Gongylonema pulchrum]